MLAVIEWKNLIVEPVSQMLTKIMAYLPVLLGALVILIVGWIVAKAIKRIVDWLLKLIRFDMLADKAGISEILKKGDLKISAGEVISSLVYWLIIIMVLVMTVDALGLPKVFRCSCKLICLCPEGHSSLACSGGCYVSGQFCVRNSSHGCRQCQFAQTGDICCCKPMGDYNFRSNYCTGTAWHCVCFW